MKGQTKTGISKAYINSTQYAGNIEYKAEKAVSSAAWNLSYSLDAIYNPEGVVRKAGTELVHHYYRRDHLGNIREVWQTAYTLGSTTKPASTVQQTQYYPSGLPWAESTGASMQPYKHNGKEFIETHGYDVTDHGNRGLYHAINRYTTTDRFAEKFPWQSPYVHAGNNPVRYVDVNGDFPIGGAIIGAGLDYGIQVARNVILDGGFSVNAFTDVDKKSIAVSAVTGMAGAGLTSKVSQTIKLAKLGKTATTVTKVVGEGAVNGTLSAGGQLVTNGEVSLGQVSIDVGAGVIGRKLGNKVQDAKQASSEGKLLQRQTDRAQRLTRGDNARASRVEKAQQATKKAENFGKPQAAATSVATSTTISKTYEELVKSKADKRYETDY